MDKKILIGNDMRQRMRQRRPEYRASSQYGPTKVVHYSVRDDKRITQHRAVSKSQTSSHKVDRPSATRKSNSYIDNLNVVAYDLIIIVMLGFIAIGTAWISWAFLLYGIVVIAKRVASQRVFLSALICLVFAPIVSILKRDSLANNFAIFTFYFLVIGVIRLGLEIKQIE